MNRYRTTFFSILFWIVTAAFIALLGYYIVIGADAGNSETNDKNLSVKWYSENNIEVDPDDHSYYSAIAEGNVFSIHHEAEQAIYNAELAFETAFADADVFLNGNAIYSTNDDHDANASILFVFDSPSPELHTVNIGNISAGDVIKIDVHLYYSDGTDGISELVFGEANDVTDALMKNDLLGLCLCAMLLALGVIMLVMRFSSRRNVLTSGFEHMALFAFFSAAFSFFNSPLLCQKIGFTSDITFILYCLSFALMFLPLILFFAENMTMRASQNFLFADSVFQTVFIAASVTLAVIGIADLRTTHFYIEIIGCVQFALILIMLVLDFVKKIERRNSDLTLLIIYAVFLAIAIMEQFIDLSNAIPVMWLAACLFFMIAVAVIKVRSVSERLESVTETEKIGKLAFEDGLTGVGNTAAFRRKLSHLEVVKINYKTIAIVQFDINNLKTINDNLGHEMGDKLITDGSAMISRIFGKIGDIYRTGGDEFVAIICGDKAASLCDEAINDFEEAMEEYNSDSSHKFKLQVAYGVEYYRSDTDKRYVSLRQIQKKADEKMYNKKREMKAAMKGAIAENVIVRTDQNVR